MPGARPRRRPWRRRRRGSWRSTRASSRCSGGSSRRAPSSRRPASLSATRGSPLPLDEPRQYRLEADVGESAMGRVRLGETVPVMVDAVGQPLNARVAEVIPAADPASRSVTVKLDLPAVPGLRSGAFGRARFPAGERKALLVPARALVERGQLTGVYVVDERSVARLRLVTAGQRRGERVEILSGLNPGERVVTEGVERVTDGGRVETTS